ncbi:MAG: zinc ribbon domain-containing protein [Candidatus Eisenbacteria bacterium]|nr:zinc ribbon domain-containing protein [Candidatus Eisenbacteria bacterium]
MPIYEYECKACGSRFEELESFEARDKPHTCPVCGARKSRPLVSRVAGGATSSCASCSAASCRSCGSG